MRAVPGCAVQQQALAAEAAAVVRDAVALARRRGHAQVTPLHVATAMLSSSPYSPSSPAPAGPGLLRAACLRSSSRSHPLQCKALELCFNVALNRLPTAAFHGGHGGASSPPALSNALVAAFKRAQAHHRRGSGESSPAPAPPLPGGHGCKVELEQLVVSILDDPSVSRVMREAGFSSSLVKANVERSPPSDPHHTATTKKKPTNGGHGGGGIEEDAMRVLECMALGQHRCVVAVDSGDGGARAERAVKAAMDMASKAELPLGREYKQLACVQFVPLRVSSFRAAARAEVDAKAGELRALAREAQRAGKGLVVVAQDLDWAADFWAEKTTRSRRPRPRSSSSSQEEEEDYYYCPVEHAVMAVGGLLHEASSSNGGGGGGGGSLWVLGFASEAVLARCRAGQPPSLAAVWGIHPVVFPGDGGGGLSLATSCCSSGAAGRRPAGWPPLVVINGAGGESELAWSTAPTWPEEQPSIPPWLRRYHDPNLAAPPSSCGTDLQLQDLWKPSPSVRSTPELTLSFSSPSSPAPAAANYSHSSKQPWQLLDAHQLLQLRTTTTTPKSPPESTSAQSSSSGGGCPPLPRFMELTAENLKTLCTALEGPCVPPRCKDLVPAVASVVLRRRSGVTTRRRTTAAATWLVFRGDDGDGKKAMAMELARLVFGSYADFAYIINVSADHSAVVSNSDEFCLATTTTALKRRWSRSPDDGRHGRACAQSTKLYEALRENPRRVIMVDGAEQLDINDGCIKEAIANGRMRCSSSSAGNGNGNGSSGDDSVGLEDAIVVLSFDDSLRPRVKSQRVIIGDDEEGGDGNGPVKKKSPPSFSLDLNACATGDEEEETCNLVEDDDVEIGDDVDGVFFFQLPRDLSH